MTDHQLYRSPYAERPLEVAMAYLAGREAYALGRDESACPYPPGSHEHGAWLRGYALDQIVSLQAHEADASYTRSEYDTRS